MGAVAGAMSCSLIATLGQDLGETGDVAETISEPAIPQAYPIDRYIGVWMKSPFQFEVVGEVMATPESFARDYVLTGLIQDGDHSIAYIQNSKTGETTRLTSEEDADGFELIKANPSPDPRVASVEVRRGNETATLKYGDDTFAQAATGPGAGTIPGGGGGQMVPNGINPGRSGALPGRPASPQARPPQAANANANANGGEGNVVNPAALRLQQLREKQQQANGGAASNNNAESPRSRRRVILPSQSAGRAD